MTTILLTGILFLIAFIALALNNETIEKYQKLGFSLGKLFRRDGWRRHRRELAVRASEGFNFKDTRSSNYSALKLLLPSEKGAIDNMLPVLKDAMSNKELFQKVAPIMNDYRAVARKLPASVGYTEVRVEYNGSFIFLYTDLYLGNIEKGGLCIGRHAVSWCYHREEIDNPYAKFVHDYPLYSMGLFIRDDNSLGVTYVVKDKQDADALKQHLTMAITHPTLLF